MQCLWLGGEIVFVAENLSYDVIVLCFFSGFK